MNELFYSVCPFVRKGPNNANIWNSDLLQIIERYEHLIFSSEEGKTVVVFICIVKIK